VAVAVFWCDNSDLWHIQYTKRLQPKLVRDVSRFVGFRELSIVRGCVHTSSFLIVRSDDDGLTVIFGRGGT